MTSSIVEFATRTAVRCLPLLAQYELITGKKLARWSVIFLFAQLGLSGQQSKPKQTPRPRFTSAQSAPATLHGSFASLRMTGSHLAPLRFDSNAPVHHLNQVINWYRHARTGVPIYAGYSKEIERQHADIERRVDILIATPRPEARLQFADGGLELLVRYPVEIRRAPDIDEEMTRRVLQLIATDTDLKAAVSGTPTIRSAIKG